jgi:Tfp pilus assembly protein PilV
MFVSRITFVKFSPQREAKRCGGKTKLGSPFDSCTARIELSQLERAVINQRIPAFCSLQGYHLDTTTTTIRTTPLQHSLQRFSSAEIAKMLARSSVRATGRALGAARTQAVKNTTVRTIYTSTRQSSPDTRYCRQ